MRRRAFLFGSAACLVPVPALTISALGSFDSRVTGLILSDIDPSVSVDHLLIALDVLVGRGIPVTCIVDPADIDGRLMPPSYPLAQLLAGYALQSNAVEFAAIVPGLGAMKEYFQARAAREAISALLRYLPQTGREESQRAISTLACSHIDAQLSPSGVRSAGVSMVLTMPTDSSPVYSEAWSNGTVRLFGGRKMNMRRYSSGDLEAGEGATQSLLYISAKDIEGLSIQRLTTQMNALADDILANERRGGGTAQYVRDLLWRDDYDAQRRLGIYLCAPPPNDALATQAIRSIREDLLTDGYHVTVGGAGEGSLFWVTNKEYPDGTPNKADDHLVQVVPSCGNGALSWKGGAGVEPGPGHLVKLTKVEEGVPGFDGCGHLHILYRRIRHRTDAAAIRSIAGASQDLVLTIEASAVATPAERTLLRRELHALSAEGVCQIVPVREIAHVNFPHGAEIERQRRTQAALHRTKNQPHSKTAAWRSALMDDAKIAWKYFEQYSNPSTGLCPAAVDFSPRGGRIHRAVTMWDVGSHINGLVAANQLELLLDKDFARRISLILNQLRGRMSQGRLLPQGWIVYDRQKWGNKDFDGSDAGRLLASLDNLRRHTGPDDRLEKLVESWDLDQILVDSRVHSVIEGQLVSAYRSHSAHYSARAFRRWGHDVRSPYEVFSDREPYDGQVALLEAASWIGPIGAEPLLLEAMEIGMSAESAYLAEMLFAAQLEEFEKTGRLVAVSEGPIDSEPWFTYQGLQLDSEERTWAIDTVGGEPEYRQPSFWREAQVFSPKAAFLWAAYKPHEFSHRLLAYAREKAPTKSGFASSVFMKDGRPTDTYSDINTNGVILEAIAELLS